MTADRDDKTKIRRGDAVRRKPVKRARTKGVAKKPSMLAQAVARSPVTGEQMRSLGRYAAFGAVFCLLGAGAIAMQLPQMAGQEIGEAIGRAGFQVKRVEIVGIEKMERLPVYAVALDQQSMAMPLVELEQVRQDLLQFGWIKDARVSRRLPDTLVVDIVERVPVAVWQNNQKLSLVDSDGIILAPVNLSAMPDLPLVIGPDANRQVQDVGNLLAAVPSIKPVLAAATWVGGRRWDLRFHSGEVLALPEGQGAARTALVKFARLDANARMLGKGFARFDMRLPDRLVVRKADKSETSITTDTETDPEQTT
jgi:cell division protein FtsQ